MNINSHPNNIVAISTLRYLVKDFVISVFPTHTFYLVGCPGIFYTGFFFTVQERSVIHELVSLGNIDVRFYRTALAPELARRFHNMNINTEDHVSKYGQNILIYYLNGHIAQH